jgi:4,5-DOPA dioxygenase extradiol
MYLVLPSNRSWYIYFVVLLVSLSIPLLYHTTQHYRSTVYQAVTTETIMPVASGMPDSSHMERPSRTPIYFLGIGGPNFMEDTKHPAYAKLAEVGQEITSKVNPKGVVVFSAHWQEGPKRIKINVVEETDLIYDFYGFPQHYYEYEYPNKGSPQIAGKVIEKLSIAGIEVEGVRRGLDHGVWAGFMVGRL